MSAKIRVLVAEDDALVAELVEQALRVAEMDVVGRAHDGRVAIELTCELKPDVVVMDLKMPGVDGLEASRAIQERCPTPIVVLTAYAEQDIVGAAASVGAGAYLVKPPSPEGLRRAVTIARARFDDLMQLRRLNEELRQALDSIKALSGLLPICSSCKKIRDDQGNWQQVEVYIHEHAAVDFSHSICPRCSERLYPEYPDLDGDESGSEKE